MIFFSMPISIISSSRGLPRKSYSISYKLKVLSFCDLHGRKATIQEFHIDSSMLCRWLKARDSFESSLSTGNKYRIGSPGRNVTHSDLESSELYRWIINHSVY
jgi:hypothetical protein